jgi:hypothetical protein
VQDLSYSSTNILVSSFRLTLVPVWVTKITAREQTGLVLINGLTGAIHSELPEHGLVGWLGELLGS